MGNTASSYNRVLPHWKQLLYYMKNQNQQEEAGKKTNNIKENKKIKSTKMLIYQSSQSSG